MAKLRTKCIEWTGSLTKKGYGQLKISGLTFSAHRLAFLLANGGGLTNLQVLHKCDNRKCINPRHLFLGTNIDNVADRQQKGRQIRGEVHPKAKLTNENVKEIRKLVASGISQGVIAKRYTVNFSTIFNIVKGKTWKHL